MYHGSFFTSDVPGLAAHVRTLDERLAALFPELADGRAAGRLRLCPDELTGRGVSLADGYRPELGTALALYSGHVVADWPLGDYVLSLPPFRRDGRTWHPSVDAAVRCRTRQPPLCSAALFNHSCHDATGSLRRPAELRDCPLSCAVAYPTAELQAGGRLLWDYDGGAPLGNAAYSMDLSGSLQLRAEGFASVPCACRGAQPCPRQRWFRVW